MAETKRRPGPHGPGGGQRHGYQKPKDMKGTVKKLLRYMIAQQLFRLSESHSVSLLFISTLILCPESLSRITITKS